MEWYAERYSTLLESPPHVDMFSCIVQEVWRQRMHLRGSNTVLLVERSLLVREGYNSVVQQRLKDRGEARACRIMTIINYAKAPRRMTIYLARIYNILLFFPSVRYHVWI